AMERQVPGGVPRIFPFVRHRHDALVVKMTPLCVAAVLSLRRRRWLTRIALEPILNYVVVELLRPKHSGQRLAMNEFVVGTQTGSLESGVKFVRFIFPGSKNGVEMLEGLALQHRQAN